MITFEKMPRRCFSVLLLIFVLQQHSSGENENIERSLFENEVCRVEERNLTLKPGQHDLDPSSCEIKYCRKNLIRYAELDFYTCDHVSDYRTVYRTFFKDCKRKKCLPK